MFNLLAAAEDTIQLDKLPGFEGLTKLTIPGIVTGLIGLILIIAFLLFFFFLVYGGIRWIASGGDKAHTEAARNQITSALVGLVIVVSAWAIAELISRFFGINFLRLVIPKAF